MKLINTYLKLICIREYIVLLENVQSMLKNKIRRKKLQKKFSTKEV